MLNKILFPIAKEFYLHNVNLPINKKNCTTKKLSVTNLGICAIGSPPLTERRNSMQETAFQIKEL